MDALGISDHSIEQSKAFMKDRDIIVNLIGDFSKGTSPDSRVGDARVYTFGDTLLLTWDIRDVVGIPLVKVGELLRHILAQSLDRRILWRGAMSIGKFIENRKSNTLIGPAVADAAAWYEAANWFDVMATPACSLVIRRLFEEMSGSEELTKKLSETFVEYKVPLKGGSALQVPAIGWPFHLLKSGTIVSPGGNRVTPLSRLYKALSRFTIPAKTEVKYFNAIDFYKHCHDLAKTSQEQAPAFRNER